jgi:hypothetical protein
MSNAIINPSKAHPSLGFAVWIFSNVGWEKGNFGKRDIEMGYSPRSAWLSVITPRGNFR